MDERLVNETYRLDENKLKEIIEKIENIKGEKPKTFSVKALLSKEGVECVLCTPAEADLGGTVIGRIISGQGIGKAPSAIYLQTALMDIVKGYGVAPKILLDALRDYIR